MEKIDNPNLCSNTRCSVPGAKFQCKCENVRYCGTECQAEHWSEHKRGCSIRLKKQAQKAKDGMNVREAADASVMAGRAHQQGGELPQAEQCFLEALRMRSIVLKDVVPEEQVAEVQLSLGRLYMEMGRYEESLKLYNQTLRVYRKVYGNKSTKVFEVLHCIGNALHFLLRFDEALETYHESLATAHGISEEHSSSLSGAETMETKAAHVVNQAAIAASLTSIGQVYGETGETEKALGYYQRALKVHRMCASLGWPEHNVAITLDAMGGIQLDEGQLEQAAASHGEALEIHRRIYGEKSPYIANSLYCIGNILISQGKYEDAHKAAQKSLEIRRNALGDKHDEVADSFCLLGQIYVLRGMHDEALKVHKQGLDITIANHGVVHELVARYYRHIAKSQNYKECVDSLIKAARIFKRLGIEDSYFHAVVEDLRELGILDCK